MINQEALYKFLTFIALVIASFSLELVIEKLYRKVTGNKHKTYHFSFAKYIYFMFLPMVLSLVFFRDQDIKLLPSFFGFMAIGTFTEGMGGFFYQKIMGKRLWTYHRYSIGGYTSLLSMPMWGVVGLIYYPLIQVFN